jgi:hypothetical protein
VSGPFGGLSPRTEPDGEPRGLGLVLPGRAYSPAAPLLEFARLTLLQHGYAVQQVWWDSGSRPADVDPSVWVRDQAAAALAAEAVPPRRVVIVAKSLGTWAAQYAADEGFDAIWLTPLLVEPTVVFGIQSNSARQLLVGGSADQFWDGGVAAGLVREGCELMEIPDADHGLCVPDDVVRSASIHADVTRRMDAFLSDMESV